MFFCFYHISGPTAASGVVQLPLCRPWARQTSTRKLLKSRKSCFLSFFEIWKFRDFGVRSQTFWDLSERDRAFNFDKLYLRAQMELERVLGLVCMLRKLVRAMRTFLRRSRYTGSLQMKWDIFCKYELNPVTDFLGFLYTIQYWE